MRIRRPWLPSPPTTLHSLSPPQPRPHPPPPPPSSPTHRVEGLYPRWLTGTALAVLGLRMRSAKPNSALLDRPCKWFFPLQFFKLSSCEETSVGCQPDEERRIPPPSPEDQLLTNCGYRPRGIKIGKNYTICGSEPKKRRPGRLRKSCFPIP